MPEITEQTASEMAKRSVFTRAERRRLAAELPLGLDFYTLKRLARTRKQIDSLSDMLEHEQDPAKIDRLASAIDRLAKHEHYLAGRPGPGNRKPAPERTTKRNFAPTPQPVVPEQARVNDPNEPNG